MAKVSTNISIDAETKAQAQAILADLGLDLSTAVNIFLRQMVYEDGIPFRITRRTHNLVTLAEKGEDMHGPFHDAEDMSIALTDQT